MSLPIICTLYEGRYHFGVAALANSVYAHGFRGDICIGYKGTAKAPWATPSVQNGLWSTYSPADGLRLHFLELKTPQHLTNFKQNFLVTAATAFDPDGDRKLFYFDPDIVIFCPWEFFETWADCGVALCEDINSPLHDSHPTRHAWRRQLTECGLPANRVVDMLFNGGFIGISPNQRQFIQDWLRIQKTIEPLCGTHSLAGPHSSTTNHFPNPFIHLDQDALNMAAMGTVSPLSVASKQAMYFVQGGQIMAHAIMIPKPWDVCFLLKSLKDGGRPPTAHRLYFNYLTGPIRPVSSAWRVLKKFDILLASLIGRFWS